MSRRVGVVVAAIGKLQLQQLTIGLTTWYRQRPSGVPYLPNLQYLQCLGRQASLGRQVSLGSQGILQYLQYLLQRCKYVLQVSPARSRLLSTVWSSSRKLMCSRAYPSTTCHRA